MYHNLIIVGNLGRDPEMRYTPGGTPVTSFNVATNRQYTNSQGERVKETIWFRVSAWNKLAEICNTYLRKGSKILIEGRLTPDPATGGPKIWTRQDGSAGASFEVTANTIQFLDSRSDSSEMQGQETNDDMLDESEIPF